MDELAKLKWQCRRGTKELDFLLNRYLETGYLVADREEKALFVELLALEDDSLIGILRGDFERVGMAVLVAKVSVRSADCCASSYGYSFS